jgi:cbb3-type cytochrome oxidase maturation protein
MSVVFIVFPLALLIAAIAVLAFIWATRSGQFDDMDTPAMRMLHDDERSTVDSDRQEQPGSDEVRSRRTGR